MATKTKNIEIVSISFVVVYTVIFIYLILFFTLIDVMPMMAISLIILLLLLINFYIVNISRNWSRTLLLSLMCGLSLYFGYLYFVYPLAIHWSYLVINILVIIFFSQKHVKFRYEANLTAVRKCILLIDDDESLQKTIQRLLLPKGYSVLTATTGEKGLQVARTQKPDLILLDVILPGIKGREVCRSLKEDPVTVDIPVIFLTAKDSPDDINAERAAGAISHLTKPVDSKLLITEIKKILR